ncbi:MAG: LysE family transporter [Bacteroidaceae bacterium]|nr:LysE family transporter [Bacteroidaceae bacterium]
MIFVHSVDVIDLMLRGLMIGIIASAPMGPIGILVVQRTLKKGRWYGFATGVGAALSDIVYAIITGLGMSLVFDFIEKPSTMLYLRLIGSIMLFLFGLWMFKSKPAEPHAPSGKLGSYTHNGLTGFLLTLSNPLIVFLFVALYARLNFVVPNHLWEQTLGYAAILAGSLLWWACLTSALRTMKDRLSMSTISFFNRLLGALVMAVSGIGFILTVIGKL